MPLGIQQNNNFLHLTMDVWQDQIFFNETVYPAGHFAAELLNVPEETIRELVTHGGAISHQVEALVWPGEVNLSTCWMGPAPLWKSFWMPCGNVHRTA